MLAEVPHGDVEARDELAEALREKEEVWRAVHARPGGQHKYSSSLRSAAPIPTHAIRDPTNQNDETLASLYPAEQHPRMMVEPVSGT